MTTRPPSLDHPQAEQSAIFHVHPADQIVDLIRVTPRRVQAAR